MDTVQLFNQRKGGASMENGFWFKSNQFKLQQGEEEQTNVGCFGKSLAEWLSIELSKAGYKTDVIPEDWGWCVMCESSEFLLWIGCSSMNYDNDDGNGKEIALDVNTIIWHVFTEIEVPFFMLKSQMKKWVGRLDLASPINKLNQEVKSILKSNNAICFCDEP
jgi:hypothetical protein